MRLLQLGHLQTLDQTDPSRGTFDGVLHTYFAGNLAGMLCFASSFACILGRAVHSAGSACLKEME